MSSMNSKKVKNPCKICTGTVNEKNGLQCRGACKKWTHFKCLRYTPGKILDIKKGYIQVKCPCPNCETHSSKKKNPICSTPYYCGKSQCPADSETSHKTSPLLEKGIVPDPKCSPKDCESVVLSVLSLCKTNNACMQGKTPPTTLPIHPSPSKSDSFKQHCPEQYKNRTLLHDKQAKSKQTVKDCLESRRMEENKLSRLIHTDAKIRSRDCKRPYFEKDKSNRQCPREMLAEVETDKSGVIKPNYKNYGMKNGSPVKQLKSNMEEPTDTQHTVTNTIFTKPDRGSESSQSNYQITRSVINCPKTRSQSTYVSNRKRRKNPKVIRTRDTHTCTSAKLTIPLFSSSQDSLISLPLTEPFGSDSNLTNSLSRLIPKDKKSLQPNHVKANHPLKSQKSFEEVKRCKSDSCLLGPFSGPRSPLVNAMEQLNDVVDQCRELMGKLVNYFKGNC